MKKNIFNKFLLLIKEGIKSIFQPMITPIYNKFSSQNSIKRRTNIMSSVLWIVGIIYPSSGTYFIWGDELWIKIFFVCIDVFVAGYFIYKYEYFSKNDPDRLQTEEYLVALKEIEHSVAMQGEKSEPKGIESNSTNRFITNG